NKSKPSATTITAEGLDLLDVGEAIASDNTTSVENWISEQLLTKPSSEQLGTWNVNKAKRFNALIVEPYVLIQEKAAA
ncbi:MAG: DUF2288 family protein, partial [Sphaerospermopsis sp. SIO1G2]|nr:DUF2288 family protein [Sphaerospermopsis sp. SIO1G2]